jgi:hypothetical protein
MATLQQFSMRDTGLFYKVRASGLTDQGLYLGHDPGRGGSSGDIYCVLADTCFYDLEVFLPETGIGRFSGFAQTATTPPATVRVVVNGQPYDPSLTSREWLWDGDIIDGGVVMHGVDNENESDARYFGKWSGRTDVAYDVCRRGSPVEVTPPLSDALSDLLPIIRDGNPFSIGPGPTQYYSPTLVITWFNKAASVGKVIYGIHRATQLLCFFVQQDNATGFLIQEVIRRLQAMGIDDAVMGDGSSSACLVVDGQVVVTPGLPKNLTIPVGLQLRRQTLSVEGGSTTFVQCDDFALSLKLGTLPSIQTGVNAGMIWGTVGLDLMVTSFGGGLTAAELGVAALPLTLTQTTPDNSLVDGVHLGSADGLVSIDCQIVVSGPNDRGRLTGAFAIKQSVSMTVLVSGTIDWPLL